MLNSRTGGAECWAILALMLALAGCGTSEAIVLRPKTAHVERQRCPAAARSFALAKVQDKRGYSNPNNVGFTQTGLLNKQTSLETARPAAEVMHRALERALTACGLRARKETGPDTLLQVELVTLQLTEQTGLTSETIKGQVRYEVEAVDASSRALLKRFVVTGEREASGIDTTSDAEPVIAGALDSSVEHFLKELATLPSRSTSAVAGVAPAPPSTTPSTVASSRVSATAHRLTPDQEEERFSTTLRDKNVMSVELSLKRDGSGMHPIKLRRHHIRLLFDDGTERFPLDPLKVQERHRMNLTVLIYGGGLLFVPLAVETSGNTTGLASAGDELVMPTARNELRGMLFFDLEGAASTKPKRLELEYEDTETGAVQRTLLDFR